MQLHKIAPGRAQTEQKKARPATKEAVEIQKFGRIATLPNGLSEKVCRLSVEVLNQVLADTITLRDLYKKHHWQTSGATFYQLHLLYDKHYNEQAELADRIAERIQILGGISIAMAADVAETSKLERPPRGREEVPAQLARLLEGHQLTLRAARDAAEQADQAGDLGTNDLLISQVIRSNELQVWFIAEHLVPLALVRDDAT
jgi:starvation-inducible DNA-binding protein